MKEFIKHISMILFLLFQIFSISPSLATEVKNPGKLKLPKYVQTCSDLAFEKIKTTAERDQITLNKDSFSVCGVDDRWYNPSKCAVGTDLQGEQQQVEEVVQYYFYSCY